MKNVKWQLLPILAELVIDLLEQHFVFKQVFVIEKGLEPVRFFIVTDIPEINKITTEAGLWQRFFCCLFYSL